MRGKPSGRPSVVPGRKQSSRARRAPAKAPPLPTVATLAGVGAAGEPWIDLPALGRSAVPARSTVALGAEQIGREVLVTWADGDPGQPIVTGVLRRRGDPAARPARLDAVVDGESIVLTGRREVVLRCGKASIALSADGAVVIKGVKLLTSASGVHRIRGGAVQIN
jgi:hypothetical protein